MATDTTLLAALARLQAALLLLSAGGELAVMGGNPVYLVVPLAAVGVLLRCAWLLTGPAEVLPPARIRRAVRLLVGIEAAALAALPLSVLAGLTPWVSWTPTLTGLATSFALPAGMLVLALRARPAVAA